MEARFDALRETVVEWLIREESSLDHDMASSPDDPEMRDRLRVWNQHLQVYERLERARQAATPSAARPAAERRAVPEAIELGLRLLP